MIPGVQALGPMAKATTEGKERAREAGREFEAIFVRTILRASPLGQSSGQYGELALDGIAKAVTSGRGLGIADMLASTLAHAADPAPTSAEKQPNHPATPAQAAGPSTVSGG